MKPFWKSRKFIYAAGTFLAALVLTILPMVVELEQETLDLLDQMLPLVFVIGLALIGGHTATDLVAIWQEGVVGKELAQAAHDLIDALSDSDPVAARTIKRAHPVLARTPKPESHQPGGAVK